MRLLCTEWREVLRTPAPRELGTVPSLSKYSGLAGDGVWSLHYAGRTAGRYGAAVGYAPSTIHRVWRAFCLKPRRSETFKLDPLFVEKVRDIVGLSRRSGCWASTRKASPRPHATAAADAARATADPRLQAQRHGLSVRSSQCRHRQGDRQVLPPPSQSGVPQNYDNVPPVQTRRLHCAIFSAGRCPAGTPRFASVACRRVGKGHADDRCREQKRNRASVENARSLAG